MARTQTPPVAFRVEIRVVSDLKRRGSGSPKVCIDVVPVLGTVPGMSRPRREASRTDAPRGKFELLVEEWERALLDSSGFTAKHASKSGKAVREFLAHSGGETTRSAGRTWLAALNAAGSRKTAANKLSALRQWGEYLEQEGHVTKNPWQGLLVARGYRAPGWAPFTLDEVRKLITTAETREATPKRGTNTGPLASTWYGLLALTGLRYSECRALKWDHVDLDAGTLTVRSDKARRADTIPLATEAIAALQIWRSYCRGRKWSRGDAPARQKSGFIFPQAPSHHTLQADMEAAGIAKSAETKGEWHRFRKTAIAERAAQGASVRDLYHFARHSDPSTTLSVYDRATVAQLRPVADLMPRLNGFVGKVLDLHAQRTEDESVKASSRDQPMKSTTEQPTPPRAKRSRGLDNRNSCDARGGVSGSVAASAASGNGAGGNCPSGLLASLVEAHLVLLRLLERSGHDGPGVRVESESR